MAGMKMLAALGVLCLVATASAQTSTLSSLLGNTLDAGSYLVNGTGVIYDANTITLVANGQAIQTLPRNALAPGPALPYPIHDHESKDGKGKEATVQPTASGPSATPSDAALMDQGMTKQDPLDKIVIGRKMM